MLKRDCSASTHLAKTTFSREDLEAMAVAAGQVDHFQWALLIRSGMSLLRTPSHSAQLVDRGHETTHLCGDSNARCRQRHQEVGCPQPNVPDLWIMYHVGSICCVMRCIYLFGAEYAAKRCPVFRVPAYHGRGTECLCAVQTQHTLGRIPECCRRLATSRTLLHPKTAYGQTGPSGWK